MPNYVFAPPALVSVAIAGSQERFPLHRVYCVGRNYAAHAREMGGNPDREEPFFFMKPADAVVAADGELPFPPETNNLHHEIELIVALSGGGRNIAPAKALDLVFGYSVGIDLTRRDLQDMAKKAGRPWEWGKSFDASGPVAPLVPVGVCGHPSNNRIWLAVNGTVRQDASLAELIWPVADIIAFASRSMELKPGDLFFTGTPAGVGVLQRGDSVAGGIEGLAELSLKIV